MPIPPKAAWIITSSAPNSSFLADDEFTTVWTAEGPDAWIEVDLGGSFEVAGVEIDWEHKNSRVVRLLVDKGQGWEVAAESGETEGRTQVIPIDPAPVSRIRLELPEPSWGTEFAIPELSLLEPGEQIVCTTHPGLLLGGSAKIAPGETAVIDFGSSRELQGVRLFWGATHGKVFDVEARTEDGEWKQVAFTTAGIGGEDSHWWRCQPVRFLRVVMRECSGPDAELIDVRWRLNNRSKTPLGAYERAAQRHRQGLYMPQMARRQTYWTVVGTPHQSEESLFDEFGAVEAFNRGPAVSPLLLLEGELRSPLDAESRTHRLAEGSLPIPGVTWIDQAVELDVEAAALWDEPITAVQYKVTNKGKHVKKGALVLVLRPHQVNPEWQHGGLSFIDELGFQGGAARVNGQDLLAVQPNPSRTLITPFRGGDVTESLLGAPLEGRIQPRLNSGAMEFSFDLQPGESLVVEARFARSQEAKLDGPWGSYEEEREEARARWRDFLGPRRIRLGDHAIEEVLEAEVVYTLVNQNGPALQPGSRNYNRTWIRDGCSHSFVLLQAGLTQTALDYVRWYAQRVQPDGYVPPILNPDGTINEGWGADNELDAQGQFVFAVYEAAKMSGDSAFMAEMWPTVKSVLAHTLMLCRRPKPEGSAGILPPSISHEGYGRPTYSYWDDFWALRGWLDGYRMAQALGDKAAMAWCHESRAELVEAVRNSIRFTMDRLGWNVIPGSADGNDFDPTSTSISFFPCESNDSLPEEHLQATYDKYMERVRARYGPNWKDGFTPYEIRNINALAGLGRLDEAHEVMDFMVSCQRPAAWRFWPEVVIGDAELGDYIGDMPHTWIGAEFWTAVRQMVVKEDINELTLFSGVKRSWLERDGIILTQLPTHHGEVTLSARLEGGTLVVSAPQGLPPHKFDLPFAVEGIRLNGELV